MLIYIFSLSVLAYLIIGYFTFCEYKNKFMFEKTYTLKKIFYLFTSISLYSISGIFLLVFGYFIFNR